LATSNPHAKYFWQQKALIFVKNCQFTVAEMTILVKGPAIFVKHSVAA